MSEDRKYQTEDGKDLSVKGPEWVCVNPFSPESEWVRVEEFAARQREAAEMVPKAPGLKITKTDLKNKTVTLESE